MCIPVLYGASARDAVRLRPITCGTGAEPGRAAPETAEAAAPTEPAEPVPKKPRRGRTRAEAAAEPAPPLWKPPIVTRTEVAASVTRLFADPTGRDGPLVG